MRLSSTFSVLLLLTWMNHGSSTVCDGTALTYEKRELFALYDKIEAAVNSLLPSKELKDVVHDINKKLKSRLCDINIEGKAVQEIIKTGSEVLLRILNKRMDINEIMAFLFKTAVDNLDIMMSNLMKKPNNKAPPATY